METAVRDLAAHLTRYYGVSGEIDYIPRRRAHNYRVTSDGNCWLFKIFQAEYGIDAVLRAARFVQFAARSGFPVEDFRGSLSGAAVVPFGSRAAVLIPWIDGSTPEPNSLSSPSALAQIGNLCGKIHVLGARWPEGRDLRPDGTNRRLAEKRESLNRLALDPDTAPEVADEAAVRIGILDALGADLERTQAGLSTGIIHGDFAAAHVVFSGDKAIGVIDVMGNCYFPEWELMRAFFQSVPCGNSAPEDLEPLWSAYLDGYQAERRVNAGQVSCAYDAYLYQLTSSTYGLRLPHDCSLRAFGRWRTDLSTYLAANRGSLRELMASHAVG